MVARKAASLPPSAYNVPPTTATASPSRAVGIGAFVLQVLVFDSYASTVLILPSLTLFPPTAYRMPFATPTPNENLAVGMEALDDHESVLGS
jgi:hypothetical protein